MTQPPPTRIVTPSTMSRQLVDVAPAVADPQPAVADDHDESATEPRDPIGAVFSIHELLVMILSPLSIRDLSRSLCVCKQFHENILDSAEFRRTLFLDSKQATEFLSMVKGTDQRSYKVADEWQPVILREPIATHETFRRRTRVIVEPHPFLLRYHKSCLGLDITLRNFNVLKTVPLSALLFQPPLTDVTIEHWGHSAQIQVAEGVTFGAILEGVEEIRTAVKQLIVRSPRFAGYQYGLLNQLALSISWPGNEAIFNDSGHVKIARKALEKAKQFAALDELEEKLT